MKRWLKPLSISVCFTLLLSVSLTHAQTPGLSLRANKGQKYADDVALPANNPRTNRVERRRPFYPVEAL
jgi:hypothetical protein